VKTPSKAQQIKAKKAAPTTPVRAADVSFDAPAQAKREGKVIKNTAPKSERDAAAATATEAARVAAREKAAAASAAKEAKSAAKAAEAAQARADRAAKAAAPVAPAPAPAKGKASTKAPAAAPAKGKAAAPAPAKGKAAPAPKASTKAPADKAKTAAAATAKGKKELGLLLPEEVAREKTLDQIAETREKKKEARALRGMAGNTKNEVKKYKAQEKALDKKLAALAKSKRQQDARVARAKGRAAKAKQRAAKVEKAKRNREAKVASRKKAAQARADSKRKESEPVWKSASTPSRRRGHGDNVASTAWGARNLISTQVGAQGRRGPAQAREEDCE
jgi:hypothetical protein